MEGAVVGQAWQFIDFGAGTGGSFSFASSCAPGQGLAIDKAHEAIASCRGKGIEAELGDVLQFDRTNLAHATFAINLLQELPGRAAFREGLINILRAGTHFCVVQHPYFDKDPDLALEGLQVPDHFGKSVSFKPTAADYVDFLTSYRDALSLSGMAICISGEAKAAPLPLMEPNDLGRDIRVPKTMRVIFGRKNVVRFRQAMYRASSGKKAFIWEGQ